jgi:hypothetical protein
LPRITVHRAASPAITSHRAVSPAVARHRPHRHASLYITSHCAALPTKSLLDPNQSMANVYLSLDLCKNMQEV